MEDHDERRILVRIVRQRLEALGRAGIDRIPLRTSLPSRPAAVPKSGAINRPQPQVPKKEPIPEPSAPTPQIVRPSIPPPVVSSLFGEPKLEVLVPEADREGLLGQLKAEVSSCTRCPHLASTRTQTVFGEGSSTARLMFVGEAPGADEDRTGRPFVGRAGALLTDMITKGMGLTREEVYIAKHPQVTSAGEPNPGP